MCDNVIKLKHDSYSNDEKVSSSMYDKINNGETTTHTITTPYIFGKSKNGTSNKKPGTHTSYSSHIPIVTIEDVWKYPKIQRMLLDKMIVSKAFR